MSTRLSCWGQIILEKEPLNANLVEYFWTNKKGKLFQAITHNCWPKLGHLIRLGMRFSPRILIILITTSYWSPVTGLALLEFKTSTEFLGMWLKFNFLNLVSFESNEAFLFWKLINRFLWKLSKLEIIELESIRGMNRFELNCANSSFYKIISF